MTDYNPPTQHVTEKEARFGCLSLVALMLAGAYFIAQGIWCLINH